MRKALNENPVVQVVMLGVLGIVVAFLFMTRVMSGNDPAPATDSATTAPTSADATSGAAPAATAAPEAAPAAPDPSATGSPAAPAGVGFEPGKGLPASVVSAHESGDVVALLVVNSRGAEDSKLKAELGALRGRGDTSVFVVEAKDVARYSRIAEGVNLDRVPALVVIEPKRLTEGELPAASISYGFRGPESVRQAVRDALYDGNELPYHPG